MVKRVLIRPHNAGLQTYHGEVLEDVETPWSAIIERDVWEAVCAVLTDPKRYTGAVPGRKHLLSGLVLCGKCGHPMRSGLDDRKHGREASYVCAQDGCRHVSRNLAKTDKFVIGHITRRLADPDAVVTLAPRPLTRRRYATRSPRCALRSAKPKPTMTRVWLMRVG
jgi:site-specific DNA recombinase